jgi:hypothetical protein
MEELTDFQKKYIEDNYFKCPHCEFEIFVADVITLNEFTGHESRCPINSELVKEQESELAKNEGNRREIHRKYDKLIRDNYNK